MERVRRGDFPGVTLQLLQPVFVDLDNEMQARLKIDQMLSAGLMQEHYGFPTELMDGSASLETAAIFSRYESGNTDMGAIAVFDMKVLSNSSIVVDISSHPSAVRPRRQRAYGIYHRQHVDLKDSQAIKDMGITWYTYRSDPLKVERVTRGIGLLSVADDETAGILRLWLDGSIAKLNKVADPVARYLAVRIAHCPMITRALSWYKPGQPKQVKLISAARARFVIDENKEITDSIHLWSQSFPYVTKRPDPVF